MQCHPVLPRHSLWSPSRPLSPVPAYFQALSRHQSHLAICVRCGSCGSKHQMAAATGQADMVGPDVVPLQSLLSVTIAIWLSGRM